MSNTNKTNVNKWSLDKNVHCHIDIARLNQVVVHKL